MILRDFSLSKTHLKLHTIKMPIPVNANFSTDLPLSKTWEELSASPQWYSTFADCVIVDWGVEYNKKTKMYSIRTYYTSSQKYGRPEYVSTEYNTLEEAQKARKGWEEYWWNEND